MGPGYIDPDETRDMTDQTDGREQPSATSAGASPGAGSGGMPPRVGRTAPFDTGEVLPTGSTRRGPLETPPRLSGEQQRQAARRKRRWIGAGVVAALVVVALAGAAFVRARQLDRSVAFTTTQRAPIARALTSVRSADDTYNVLVVGVDGDPSDSSQIVRALTVLRVTPTRVTALSLAPDLAVRPQVPGNAVQSMASGPVPTIAPLGKLAQIGGFPTVVDTVERTFGLPVNHLVVMRFSSLGRLVDGLGGVWVNVPTALEPSTPSKTGSGSRVDAGRQLLDGSKAVTVVRDLPDGSTQQDLMSRQLLFLDALSKALASSNGPFLGPRLAIKLDGGLRTDISSRQLLGLLARMQASAPDVMAASIGGLGEDEAKAADPVAVAKAVSAFMRGGDLSKFTAAPKASVKPGRVTVTVRNGSGVSGLAAQAASILKAGGYRVRGVGNADQFVYGETLVVYKSNARAAAEAIAKSLPIGRAVPSRGMYAFDTQVLVVIGKDWRTAKPRTEAVPVQQP